MQSEGILPKLTGTAVADTTSVVNHKSETAPVKHEDAAAESSEDEEARAKRKEKVGIILENLREVFAVLCTEEKREARQGRE